MIDFKIPLHEVCAQLDLVAPKVVELRANSLFSKLSSQYPTVEPLPVLLGPGADQLPEAVRQFAAYRFYSEDRARLVQYGPRILAVNFLQWIDRFPGFKSSVEWVIDAFEELNGAPTIDGHSLGFYNRLAVGSLREAGDMLSLPLDVRPDVEFREFVYQTARQSPLGHFVTQVSVGVPDAFSQEPYLAFNLVLRQKFSPVVLDRSSWLDWLERAHLFIRDRFGESLSSNFREQWEATWRDSSATGA